nr:glycosyltransferase family 4 protein [Ornithinicoccus halotolerans]
MSFLRGQLRYIQSQDWDVHLSCSPGPGLSDFAQLEGVQLHTIMVQRDISIWRDLRAFIEWTSLIARLKPDIVNYSTPKASLLAGLAAWMLRVPTRIYVLRGLRLESGQGPMRKLLAAIEKLCMYMSTHVVAVSPSLAEEVVRYRLGAPQKMVVIGQGSSNGVDPDRFTLSPLQREDAREHLAIPNDAYCVGFVGRVRADKGIPSLVESMKTPELKDAVLIVQGRVEDPAMEELLRELGPRLCKIGWSSNVASTLAACDVLALPTHREGFPNVVLEAACMAVPAVATTATGSRDAVVHEQTGLLVPVDDHLALAEALARLYRDATLRLRLGQAARRRAVTDFSRHSIWDGLIELYDTAYGRRT